MKNDQKVRQKVTCRSFVFFTRPWEVVLHTYMARQARELLGLEKDNIVFLTMFSSVVQEISAEGYKIHYIPRLLKKEKNEPLDQKKCAKLEEDIISSGGANFTTMLIAERFAPQSGRKKVEFLAKHVILLDKLIPERCFFICSDPEHMIYWIAVELVIQKGGSPVSFRRTGVPPNHVIPGRRPPNEIWKLNNGEQAKKNKIHLEEWTQSFLKGRAKPAYQKALTQPSLTKRLRRRYHVSKHLFIDYFYGSYFADFKELFPDIIFRIVRDYKKRMVKKYCPYINIEHEKNSKIYVPLHVEPEGATLVLSHQFTNQIDFIRLLSSSTPVSTTILVKENPYMLGLRNRKFYMALNEIPRVCFINPKIPSNKIIPHIDLVATLSGTAALEGLLMGKSALIFGDPTWAPFFRKLPNFAQIPDLKAFSLKIRELLSSHANDKITENCFNQWVRELISCKFPLQLDPERHDVQISPSSQLLKETLKRVMTDTSFLNQQL